MRLMMLIWWQNDFVIQYALKIVKIEITGLLSHIQNIFSKFWNSINNHYSYITEDY